MSTRTCNDQSTEGANDDANENAHAFALGETGFWGRAAAGCLFLAANTGRVMLAHRSEAVEEPGTHGTWGGALDQGKSPEEGVRREIWQEAGPVNILALRPLAVFRHHSGFAYHNFLAIVPHEFVPALNWETQGFTWCGLDNLPAPLHPGMHFLLDASGVELRAAISTIIDRALRRDADRPAAVSSGTNQAHDTDCQVDLDIPLEQFLVGPGRDEDALDVDNVFGKTFARVRAEALAYDPNAFDVVDPDQPPTPSLRAPGYTLHEVEGGLLLCAPDGTPVGGYIACDLALDDELQGRGLGGEIVLEYYLRYGEIPTWDLDAAAYSPAGLACHEHAWRLLRDEPELVRAKLAHIAAAEGAGAAAPALGLAGGELLADPAALDAARFDSATCGHAEIESGAASGSETHGHDDAHAHRGAERGPGSRRLRP